MRINCNVFHCSSGSCWLNPYGTEPMLRRYSSCQHYSHHTLYTANKWGKVGVLAGESEQQKEAKCPCFFNNYVKRFHSSVSMWDGLLQQVCRPLNLMNLTMRRVVTKTWLDKANDICHRLATSSSFTTSGAPKIHVKHYNLNTRHRKRERSLHVSVQS